ncbi:M81 family metallopeptidase [Falsiroseomonas sp.]|uniref:M81 family metallopeptidase n=1 Tax=Falsiroseomonas sp. TaxID=2870721 RepID=UPI0027357428|nr:M81 family metallopeptidase [Falsiroseomonas sp.]MDP3419199.1 M81 family metallopeptidase [Falsiroseomonas sp.]
MKIAAAMFKHETNSFSPVPTRWEDFGPGGPIFGEAAYRAFRHSGYSLSGLLDVAEAMGAEVTVPIAARCLPSGPVQRDVFERLCDILCAAARECDAMMLDLHGAMVAEGAEDGEGELLSRIRQIRPGLPIGASLDSHANLSDLFIANCTVMPGYRTFPHTDMPETGRKAGQLLRDVLEGRLNPVTVAARVPMLPDMVKCLTDREPMSRLIAAADAAERDGLPSVTVFTGFPLADTQDTCMTVLATAHGDAARARAAAQTVADQAWSLREEFLPAPFESLQAAMDRAAAMTEGPVILADFSDNCHSGGTMDSMAVIAAALDRGMADILAGPICDPEAVARMIEAGIGATITLDIGAKMPIPALKQPLVPLRLTGTVRTLAMGRFTVEGPIFTGMPVDLGRCAVLETGRLTLLVSEGRVEALDPLQYRIFGLEPTRFRTIILKAKTNHRPAFLPLAKGHVDCQGPGVATLDLHSLDFRRVRRPIFPLDRSNA